MSRHSKSLPWYLQRFDAGDHLRIVSSCIEIYVIDGSKKRLTTISYHLWPFSYLHLDQFKAVSNIMLLDGAQLKTVKLRPASTDFTYLLKRIK
jgi:hypothetical protein